MSMQRSWEGAKTRPSARRSRNRAGRITRPLLSSVCWCSPRNTSLRSVAAGGPTPCGGNFLHFAPLYAPDAPPSTKRDPKPQARGGIARHVASPAIAGDHLKPPDPHRGSIAPGHEWPHRGAKWRARGERSGGLRGAIPGDHGLPVGQRATDRDLRGAGRDRRRPGSRHPAAGSRDHPDRGGFRPDVAGILPRRRFRHRVRASGGAGCARCRRGAAGRRTRSRPAP
jgi:hypothetical protein